MERNTNIIAFGLREPVSSDEHHLALHVLTMQAEPLYLGERVSTYGLEAAPGKRLHNSQGCTIPCIKRKLVPLDQELLANNYVMPFSQECCSPMEKALYKPFWDSFMQTVEHFDVHVPFAHSTRPTSSKSQEAQGETPEIAALTRFQTREQTESERKLCLLLGVPLNCAAFRIGDVYQEVKQQFGNDHISKAILAMSAKYGPETSIADGFDYVTKVLTEFELQKTAFDLKYKEATDASDLRILTLETQLKRKRAPDACEDADEEAMDSKKHPAEQLIKEGLANLVRAFGRKISGSVDLKLPISKKMVGRIISCFAASVGRPPTEFDVDWAKKHAIGESVSLLQTFSLIMGHCISQLDGFSTTVLAWQTQTIELFAINNEMNAKKISALEMLNMIPSSTTIVFWNGDACRLVATAKL